MFAKQHGGITQGVERICASWSLLERMLDDLLGFCSHPEIQQDHREQAMCWNAYILAADGALGDDSRLRKASRLDQASQLRRDSNY